MPRTDNRAWRLQVTSCENIRVLNVTWNKVTPKGVTVLQNATNVRNEVEKPARRTLMPLVDLQAEDEDVYRYNGMLEFQVKPRCVFVRSLCDARD